MNLHEKKCLKNVLQVKRSMKCIRQVSILVFFFRSSIQILIKYFDKQSYYYTATITFDRTHDIDWPMGCATPVNTKHTIIEKCSS